MSDASGQGWFSLFNDTAELLLGVTAEECSNLKTNGNNGGMDDSDGIGGTGGNNAYENVFSNALFKDYICRVSS